MAGNQNEKSTGPRRVLIIVNPTAGQRRQKRFQIILRHLRDLGVSFTVRETRARGDAETLAREALAERFDVLVAAGGDGTINEVINGIAGSGQPLALLPLGTANVLAVELGLNLAPEAVARVIARGQPEPVYFGRTNGRHFALMAGVGLDARIVAGVSLRLKRRIGKLAYVLQTAWQLLHYRPDMYEILLDGARHRAASVIVTKGRFYGGRFICAPEARLADPRLHVCLFERPGRWNALRYALALATGRLGRLSDYKVIPATALTVSGPVGDPVQIDGDPAAQLPISIEIDERPFFLIHPVNT